MSTIKNLKNGKASNDIPAAYLKTAIKNPNFTEEITKLYNEVWQTGIFPSEWGHSKLVALWKGPTKGKSSNPSTYRGFQIGSTLCKVMIIIIVKRVK